MRKVLMLFIRIYWLVPKKWRRECIFKNTCSKFIYNEAKEKGFSHAIKAFKKRYHQCRPNYAIYKTDDGEEWVILNDLSTVEKNITKL